VTSHDAADQDGWWEKVPPLMATVLNSAIASVEVSAPGVARVRGYAVGGAQGGQVKRVEVSTDRGETWTDARIVYQDGKWSWTLWEAEIRVAEQQNGNEKKDGVDGRPREVWCRAADESGVVQMAECDWNLRGVAYNGYGHATIPQ
jgi:sulfite oxidase